MFLLLRFLPIKLFSIKENLNLKTPKIGSCSAKLDYLCCTMNMVLEYINYKLKAQGRQEGFSPFVCQFIDECLTLDIPVDVKNDFKAYYNALRKSERKLEITDLGAGSKKLGNERKVSAIAKISGSRGKYGDLLYRLSAYYKPARILELGTSVGLGTWMLAKGNSRAQIKTVEGCPNTYRFVKDKLSRIPNIECVNSSFVDFLQSNHTQYDLIYIDGDHRGEKVKEMLDLLAPTLHDETIVIIDDIRWSKDMLDYWKQFKDMERYHLTIDLFRMGIIMNKAEAEKEDLVIKY
jgi:predicted O-methyltransferase YrrM